MRSPYASRRPAASDPLAVVLGAALVATWAGCAQPHTTPTPDMPPATATCDDPDPGPAVALPRLSAVQYANSVHDLIYAVLPAAQAQTVYAAVTPALAALPADLRVGLPGQNHGGYQRLDQNVQDAFIAQTYAVANAVGQQLTASTDLITALAGTCATDSSTGNDAACLTAFIQSFGARALRRPLDADDLSFYQSTVTGVDAGSLSDLIGILLSAPQFLYHVEHGQTQVRGTIYTLSPYEVASRLSYDLWDTSPDAALIEAATSGALATPAGYRAQVTRLASDPRAAVPLQTFFRDYLWLDEVAPVNDLVADPDYLNFAGNQLPTATTTDEMTAEVTNATAWVTAQGGTLDDIFTDRRAYATTPLLASIYNAPQWDGASEPPLSGDETRAGLITRAAFLATPQIVTNPIMKGVFIREGLLCDTVPPPPGNADLTPFPTFGGETTRQVVTQVTQTPGSVCWSCHANFINPLGFATEGFDSLGRARTMQGFWDPNTGLYLDSLPIDTTSVPQINQNDMTPSAGPADVTRLMLQSSKVHSCFSRQVLRSTFSRPEDDTADSCNLSSVGAALSAQQPLSQVMQVPVLRPEFQRRNFLP